MTGSTNIFLRVLKKYRIFSTKWLLSYNNERPNMGIGGITPP